MDITGLKIRLDAWEVLAMIAEVGYDVKAVPPGPDGWHSQASVAHWLADQFRRADERKAAAAPAAKMTVAAAFDSGRITAASRPDWEARYAVDPDGTAATLATLAPVWNNATTSSIPSIPSPKTAAEELDELDDALFGIGHSEASRQRHRNRQDEQALEEHRAIAQAETEAAGQTISADEWRAIYGTEPPDDL